MSHLQVVVSIDSLDGAERIGRALVEARLVACFQVLGPMRSIYRWKGEIEQADEWLCLAKTTTARFDEMRERLVVLHPYDNPEIIATPIVAGHGDYLDWISEQTRPLAQ
ncbi:divalent-cation tolerance protein CutA [Frankia sp. AgPm24]|uniref:Divalent-cation tolerance protein CutA n=1 Tax=Frankia umida TaxID=573489 RepID=A0ABT0JX10_9ACTN|nr:MULTISPECIES: divalent-cation tolerance protein CutA [Frankia]MCK9876089.1 divalent-cation tolerance protein CutA [Frankia umida]MCK9924366.1 divalent-cation tolerance protein CutA [Frankia sp. AgPm24]